MADEIGSPIQWERDLEGRPAGGPQPPEGTIGAPLTWSTPLEGGAPTPTEQRPGYVQRLLSDVVGPAQFGATMGRRFLGTPGAIAGGAAGGALGIYGAPAAAVGEAVRPLAEEAGRKLILPMAAAHPESPAAAGTGFEQAPTAEELATARPATPEEREQAARAIGEVGFLMGTAATPSPTAVRGFLGTRLAARQAAQTERVAQEAVFAARTAEESHQQAIEATRIAIRKNYETTVRPKLGNVPDHDLTYSEAGVAAQEASHNAWYDPERGLRAKQDSMASHARGLGDEHAAGLAEAIPGLRAETEKTMQWLEKQFPPGTRFPQALYDALNAMPGTGENVTFSKLHDIAKQMSTVANSLGNSTIASGLGKLIGKVRDTLRESVSGNDTARKAWSEFNTHHQDIVLPFRELNAKLQDMDSGKIVKYLSQNKDDATLFLQQITPDERRFIARGYLEGLIQETGGNYGRIVKTLRGLQPEIRQSLFSDTEGLVMGFAERAAESSRLEPKFQGIYEAAKAARGQAKEGSGIGDRAWGILLHAALPIATASGYLAHVGVSLGRGALRQITPGIIAHFLTNPATAQLMESGQLANPEAIRRLVIAAALSTKEAQEQQRDTAKRILQGGPQAAPSQGTPLFTPGSRSVAEPEREAAWGTRQLSGP